MADHRQIREQEEEFVFYREKKGLGGSVIMKSSLEEASSPKYGDFSLVGQLQSDWLGCHHSFLLPLR